MQSNEIQSQKEGFELIERFVENVEEFCRREDISNEIKTTVESSFQHIKSVYNKLNSLIALPPTEENIFNIKQLSDSVSLRELWDIDDIMQKEIQRVNIIKRNNEQKILSFMNHVLEDLKKQIGEKIKDIKKENQQLNDDNLDLNRELEDLQEKREEIENSSTILALAKKENPFIRFMRIMNERSDLWTEVEIGDKIILKNSNGEIRGTIPKEDEESKEAIIKTEKAIISAKRKYSIFQRLKYFNKSQVFTIEPDVREEKLNINYLEITLCRGKIEKNTKQITDNLKEIEKINWIFENFTQKVNQILECTNKEIIEIVSEIIDEINYLTTETNIDKGKNISFENEILTKSII